MSYSSELAIYKNVKSSYVVVLSRFSHVQLCNAMDYSPPGSSVHFSRQEYWSGLPCPPPGDLPNLGITPASHVSCMGRQVLYHKCHQVKSPSNRTEWALLPRNGCYYVTQQTLGEAFNFQSQRYHLLNQGLCVRKKVGSTFTLVWASVLAQRLTSNVSMNILFRLAKSQFLQL